MFFRAPGLSLAACSLAFAGLVSSAPAAASDATAPVVNSIKFVSTAIDPRTAPGAFQVKLSYTEVGDDGTDASSSGIYFVRFFMNSTTTEQSSVYDYYFDPVATNNATVTIEMPQLNLYAAAGEWDLTGVVIFDHAFNTTSYNSQQQPIPLSGGMPVVSNTVSPDITGPTITSAKLVSTTLDTSTGPADLLFKLQVADDLSGVVYVGMVVALEGVVSVGGPTHLSAPVINGSATSGITLSQGTQAGNWVVQSLQVCDRPGNCRRYADSELKAVMPKTKFKVVN